MYFVASNIKYLRRKNRFTFSDIESGTTIHKSTVASYEYGKAKPAGDNLQKLADFFKVSPEDLMFKNIERISKIHKPGESDNLNGEGAYKNAPGGTIQMTNDLILMSVEQLLRLQSEQDDAQMVKSIAQVLAYKQYAEGLKNKVESLEREIKTLQDFIEHLKKQKP